MRVTTKGRYGLRAILELAGHDGNNPVSIKAIAEKEHLSPEFLEQIFFRLRKAGLISSTRGPGGGFQMNIPASEMTITKIFDAVGEDISLAPCTRPQQDVHCEMEPDCIMKHVWEEATNHIRTYFESLSIEEILKKYGG